MKYADLNPEHCRMSCSDQHLYNVASDGTGCHRCTAIVLDQHEMLHVAICQAVQLLNNTQLTPAGSSALSILTQALKDCL